MADIDIDELGPVDYLVVRFPAEKANFSGAMASELKALIDSNTIRALDLAMIMTSDDGSMEASELRDADDREVGELRTLERDLAILLAEEDIEDIGASLEPGSATAVLVWENTWAARFGSTVRRSGEARARGVEPVELHLGDDLATLVHDAIANGADAIGVAGGDGTQAIVAAIAAERGLPYVCVPAGTRNHFALDLGVGCDDVAGALDAFTNGGERLVDLAEVNGRVFVNNVSLGVYAEAVQQEGYRDAKLRTIAETMPTVLGPGGDTLDLRFTGADGREHKTSAVVLVSNDPYRLGRALASGTRPRLDAGVLGITVLGAGAARDGDKRVQQWSAPSFEVRSDGPVSAGIDGEALKLDPPLRFRTRPRALRVRIAPQHPGASPSVDMPESPWDAIRAVTHIATHRSS